MLYVLHQLLKFKNLKIYDEVNQCGLHCRPKLRGLTEKIIGQVFLTIYTEPHIVGHSFYVVVKNLTIYIYIYIISTHFLHNIQHKN